MNVTRIDEYQSRDTIAVLRDLLARAEAGRLRGIVFSVRTGPKRHKFGMTGDYYVDPQDALMVATRMEYKINQLISARDDEPTTNMMPL